MVIGGLDPTARERCGQIAAAPRLEIHRQEGHVAGHVDPSQGVAELDRIEGNEVAFVPDDVGQVEITVALPHATGPAPRLERPAAGRELSMHREFQRTDTLADLGPVFAESSERAVDRARYRLGRPPRRRHVGDLQAILDPRYLHGEFHAALCRQSAAVEQPIEPTGLVELFQPDGPLDRFAGSADVACIQNPGGRGWSDDRHRIEVERWSEPPIEPHFLLAEVSSSLE